MSKKKKIATGLGIGVLAAIGIGFSILVVTGAKLKELDFLKED